MNGPKPADGANSATKGIVHSTVLSGTPKPTRCWPPYGAPLGLGSTSIAFFSSLILYILDPPICPPSLSLSHTISATYCPHHATFPSCTRFSVDLCDPNPCSNGGSCSVDSGGGYTCSCGAGYGGMACQTSTKGQEIVYFFSDRQAPHLCFSR